MTSPSEAFRGFESVHFISECYSYLNVTCRQVPPHWLVPLQVLKLAQAFFGPAGSSLAFSVQARLAQAIMR